MNDKEIPLIISGSADPRKEVIRVYNMAEDFQELGYDQVDALKLACACVENGSHIND